MGWKILCNKYTTKKLNRVQDEITKSFHRRNKQLSTDFCEKLMTSLIKTILKPSIDKIEMIVSYEEKRKLILEKYEKEAKGPSLDEVRDKFVPQIDADIQRGEQLRILRGMEIFVDCAAAGVAVAPGSGKSVKTAAAVLAAFKVGINQFKK